MEGGRYFGDGLTYLNPSDLKGKLVAIEGTDGVGRTTQIRLLREWLEVQGYGVIETGWTRSACTSVRRAVSCGRAPTKARNGPASPSTFPRGAMRVTRASTAWASRSASSSILAIEERSGLCERSSAMRRA